VRREENLRFARFIAIPNSFSSTDVLGYSSNDKHCNVIIIFSLFIFCHLQCIYITKRKWANKPRGVTTLANKTYPLTSLAILSTALHFGIHDSTSDFEHL